MFVDTVWSRLEPAVRRSATEFSRPPLQQAGSLRVSCPGQKRHALYPHLYSTYFIRAATFPLV